MKLFSSRQFFGFIGCVVLAAASASSFSATSQLPTCLVTADEGQSFQGSDIEFVAVDSHGNFFDFWSSQAEKRTKLDQYGAQSWKQIAESLDWRLEYRVGVSYYTTSEIEEKLCKRGKKIAFYEPLFDMALAPQVVYGIEPKPYTLVRELMIPERGAYFLSSIAAESDFVLNGGAGKGLITSSSSFRFPRVAEDLVPVHRFYGHPGSELIDREQLEFSHFYTADKVEFEATLKSISNGAPYVYEGPVFLAPRAIKVFPGNIVSREYRCSDTRMVPVIRLKHGISAVSNYRYVTDPKRVSYMTRRGWANEGASFCALRD